ncbi:MAG: aminoacyl-histidine dipeptidase [Lachnospiraceae bacterium]|nr:aminoacyl-histidine dipeptidase [Lachnospiraceae bacterium]
MGVLSGLEPQSVFYYFEEITKIPHGSGNVDRISDYLVEFARERNLFYIQDEIKNVIIVKEATPGYEEEPPVILQGHMDMVAVKKPDCDIDMSTQGLRVAVDGDKIYAEGTSLGGDDGIAVAYALAILDADDLKHPRLEVVITVDEEIGMDGAREIDLSMLQGKRLLNLDSEEEGIFLTSCAGGARVECVLLLTEEQMQGTTYELTIGGLLGGHSGAEIHKERGNSNCLFGRVLWTMAEEIPVHLVSVKGGLADNAIPRETKAVVLLEAQTEADCMTKLQAVVQQLADDIKEELATKDPDFYMKLKECGKGDFSCVTRQDTKRAAAFLQTVPNGVQAMSADMPGLVETSLNLGILEGDNEVLRAEFALRSSIESAKYDLLEKLKALTALVGGSMEVSGEYPGWKYRVDSPLREKMIALYEKMYGEAPKVEAIHAGLECGLLGSKIEDLDCVSFGPNMSDIHTTEETLSIASTARVWEYLIKLLEEKDV